MTWGYGARYSLSDKARHIGGEAVPIGRRRGDAADMRHEHAQQANGAKNDTPKCRAEPDHEAGGATDRPRTLCRSMRLATNPDAFASSTKARRNAAPATFFLAVPIAC